MTIKTIIFDFGNVIGYFSHRRALEPLLPFTKLTREQLSERVLHGELEDAFERGRITTPEFVRTVRRLGELNCTEDVIAHSLANMFSVNEPVCDLIGQLRSRYRLLLGSNTNDLHYRFYCSMFAATVACFHHRVVSHEIGVRKPEREFYEHCQRYAECAPEECVFIDDMPANITAAEAHGWKGIVFSDFAGLMRELKKYGVAVPALPAAG